MALTDTAIKALKPKQKRYYVTDERGLCLEVFPTGGLGWRYRYRLNGKLEKVALGRYPAMSLKLARQKRDELASLVAHGQSPAKQKQLAKVALGNTVTLRQFGEKYYEEIAKCSRKDPTNIRRYLDKQIYPDLGEKCIRDITASDVQALVFRKRDHGREAAAAEIRNLLKRIFDYALVCSIVDVNPTLAIPTRFITKARARTRALSPNEIRTYVQSLYRSNIRTQFKLALHLILLTLVRKSELRLAKWAHIDLEKGEWEIPAENSKTSRPHMVYLSSQAANLLRDLRALAGTSDWVLPGRSGPAKPFAHNSLNKALEGINIPIASFTIHDLRRTGSTLLHEQGFSSDVVEKALNHKIGGVRGVYNRAEYAEQRREMLQCWADFVESLATEKRVIMDRLDRNSAYLTDMAATTGSQIQ